MPAVVQEWLGEDHGRRDLVRPGGVPATRAEEDRGIVGRTREVASKRQSRVVPGPCEQLACLHAADAFADQLVWPRSSFAGWLVRPVEVDHGPVPCRVLEQRLVEVNDLLVLVIEEVDLRPDDAKVVEFLEERLAVGWRAQ